MTVKAILRIIEGTGIYNNLYDNNTEVPCQSCPTQLKNADGHLINVKIRTSHGYASSGYGNNALESISSISPSLLTFHSVRVIAEFSSSGIGWGPHEGLYPKCRIWIRTHGVHYCTDWVEQGGCPSKTWSKNPYTDEDWVYDELIGVIVRVEIWTPEGDPDAKPTGYIDYAWVEVEYDPVILKIITKPATNITNSSAMLNGEITDNGGSCTERGFEYYKDGDLGNVVTIKEEGEFSDGLYGLAAGGLLAGTKYHFRAYALNEVGIVYGSWKDFITTALPPTVSTQAASVPSPIVNTQYLFAEGNGTIETTGGQPGVYKCNERGFEVKLEFSGSLYDYIVHHIAGFEGRPTFIIGNGDIRWEGTLIKTERESGSFGEGPFTMELGSWPAGFSDKLFAGESYTYRAIATNDIGIGYGDWVSFSLGPLEIITETEVIEGETTKTTQVTVQNLADGQFATRIGIRYGTTSSANEFDVHIDGIFGIGNYKFVLTDLTPNTKYYEVSYILIEDEVGDEGVVEGPVTESETLPEDVEPEDEFTTPYYGPHGQDYREVVKKVFAEKLSVQPIIDFSGGKKTLKLDNHLIQEQNNAAVIAGNYLIRFQFAKTKMVVGYATPMPFEREDTIDFDFGRIPFKLDDEGVIPFRADGQGQIKFLHMVSVMVRKISLKMGVTEKTIDYLATLELEKE